MPTINKLPLLGTPSGGDQIPVYAPNSGDARRMSITALTDYMQDTLDLPDNSDEVSFLQSGTGAVTRTVQSKLRETVSVKDFGAVGDGVADDTAAIQAAINAHDSVWFPKGIYNISATVRASRVVNIDGDPEATLVATSGFVGISITKVGVPFTLKALIAVFAGTDIGQQSNPRIGESGDKVTIGPMRLNCNNNCDYGVLINSCPGAKVSANVDKANDTGIWAGPNCWGAAFWHNRVTQCTNAGIYVGEAGNGAAIYSPEIWGVTIKTASGIYLDGTVGGVIGAVGNVFVSGGYIEDCTNGVYLKDTGSVHVYSVDIEGIDDHAIYADCTAGNTYGTITVNGCTLIAGSHAIYNSNAYINVFGCDVVDGASLEPYFSNGANSLFNIQGTRQFTSGGTPAVFPSLTTTQTALASYETKYSARIDNKRLTDGGAAFSRSWSLFNYSSDSQPNLVSSGIEFRNTRQGGAADDYWSAAWLRANVTRSNPTAAIQSSAAVGVYHLGTIGSPVQTFSPEQDGLMQLGAASFRWTTVYATTGTINTSDEREKQDIADLDAAEKRVAVALKGLVKKFRFKDAVAAKGDAARIHVGVIAQEVAAAFTAEGLDATRYGLLCYDEWDAESDEDGNEIRQAGNRYGVRYEELLSFIIAAI